MRKFSATPRRIPLSEHTRTGSEPKRGPSQVNLELYSREVVVILGPSGSGKTTLLNVIGGIESATGGQVVINGQNLV
ncbi:MAG: ATP-binding cassette domain-containing protein, partial [Candidatus Nanopelagicales bacterium]|nr:ATP-binding cassette domain-containing protein [Candidatus Nanopelagicales bacterium]